MVQRHSDPKGNELGSTMVDHKVWKCPALNAFMLHCLDVLGTFPERGDLLVFAVVTEPANQIGWSKGYPHQHAYAYYSLIHYLEPGDAEAPLVVYEEGIDSVRHIVQPETGLTVVFKGRQLHGVLDNCGTTPRIALVVQNVPVGTQLDAPNWRYA